VIVVDPPTITGFTPTTGGAVELHRGGRVQVGAIDRHHRAGTAAASFTVVSDTRITATVAAGTTTGPITVTNEAGPVTSAANFVFIPPPSITTAPTTGRIGDGVTINGTNFTGAVVRFNGALATTTVTATQIRTNVPAGATTGPLTITTPGGVASVNFTVIIPPTITGFTPNQAGVGGVVTITGTNFVTVSKVSLGGTTVTTFTVDSPTQIRATVPTGAKSGTVQVIAIGGTANSAAQFTFVPAPIITSFTPATGRVGATVTINGTNLATTNSVTFLGAVGRVQAGLVSISATQVRVTVPAGARTGAIQLTTVGGTATSATAFGVTP
jgi:large repetitive protein